MNATYVQIGSKFYAPNHPKARKQHETQNHSPPPSPKPEQALCDDAVATAPGEAPDPQRVIVRITSFRKRLLDPDNLVGGSKYFIDGLRYAGLIRGDRQDQIALTIRQERSIDERTEIEIETP